MSQATTDRVLAAIKAFWEERGYAPSIRDLMKLAYLSSPSTVSYHLKALRNQGRVAYDDGCARSTRLASAPAEVSAYQAGHAAGLAQGHLDRDLLLRGLWRLTGICVCGAYRPPTPVTIPHASGCLVALALETVGEKP